MRILSSELKQQIGKQVTVAGWLHKKRLLGGLNFILVRDRNGLMQVLIKKEAEVEKLRNLQVGTVLEIEGEVIEDSRAPSGAELHEAKIKVAVPVTEASPIEIDKPINHRSENLDTLFEYRALNLRNLNEQAIFKIQHHLSEQLHSYFREHDFIEVHTPKLLAKPTEGGAEVFKLKHFGEEATLAQSPQFYKQMLVGAFERVYEIGPVYRAEPSITTRHMSEYVSVDAEMGYISGLADLTKLLNDLMHSVIDGVWQEAEAELESLKAVKPNLADQLPSITLEQLHQFYSKATGQDTTKEKDPIPAEERWVCEYALKEFGSEAIFITDFPASEMKFYHFRSTANPDVAVRADLIFRGVEIVTLSQREHRYNELVKQLKAIGGDPNHPGFKYFLQAFKYGMPPHGGFGLGLERLTQKIVGLNNVKEATLFPRDMQRLTP